MLKLYNRKFKRDMVIIFSGEFYISNTEIISTVLGSCVSVCMKDRKTGISGMNHFMYPYKIGPAEKIISHSAKYGVHAMKLLIEQMIGMGAARSMLAARIFGGSNCLRFVEKQDRLVAELNIEFAKSFLDLNNIPIISQDVGGYLGRKIIFFTDSGEVLLQYHKSSWFEAPIQRKRKSPAVNEILE